MSPIYWEPVNDVTSITRGTWFYKETMFPVEPSLANQLEIGYHYIQPWTESYSDEINSCLEVGPEAELRLVHKIWPSEERNQQSSDAQKRSSSLSMLPDGGDGHQDEKNKTGLQIKQTSAGSLDGYDDSVQVFSRSSVIYANAFEAQILQPHQLPSVARKRRPLSKIRKSMPVGVTVVRGFDFKLWEKLHPMTRRAAERSARATIETIRQAAASCESLHMQSLKTCPACLAEAKPPTVSDLVLVIHGIGQKLSERVESFHFTHNINAFRRQVMLELQDDTVKPFLRSDVGGMMVLPVNWRSKTDFEEGLTSSDEHASISNNHYGLPDITAESLPAVRNIITDVMLDIPYYLSHHKDKIVQAVVTEANRIYRLWCSNNPGFQQHGKVHMIAHSLGSIMALDILSQQPTKLPKQLNLDTDEIHSDMLEFDTKSLFMCGSPAGFFLLLNHATLLPRKGRQKTGMESDARAPGLGAEVGTYGSLALDNIYNVIHENDPVAYRMNACVDAEYSSLLRPAIIPSVDATWGEYLSAVLKGSSSDYTKRLDSRPTRPAVVRLPTTVELETHDFTREEVAEKRMSLLNENGQIDFFLKSGGGPLEIQYLNMLNAHSSYWISREFVRFLVVEIGRRPGREGVVNRLAAVKKSWVDGAK